MDPGVQQLMNDIWDKSTPLGLSGVGWFGAREHYGFVGYSPSEGYFTSIAFPATGAMGGYQPQHGNFGPSGAIAGIHSHWTNDPNPSAADKKVASKRPEYIVNKDNVTRVNPDGSTDRFNRDGTSKCKCDK